MRGPERPALPFELEVFSSALGCGLVAGALSLIAPSLAALSGALAALAFAGWCAELARDRPIGPALGRPRTLVALGIVGVGAVLYGFPGPVAAERGLVIALALVPLWWFARPHGLIRYRAEGIP